MSTDEVNPYELLGVELETTEAEIRKAYRTRSLKVHPDRNRNDPNAAKKFHELNQAYELLLDPLRRLALDAKLRIQNARKQRFATYDNKRKELVEELEERERAFKKAKVDRENEEMKRWADTEKIKDEGKRMREEREQEIRKRMEEAEKAAMQVEEEDAPPTIGAHDATIRLKYTLTNHPTLTTPASVASLLSAFGATDETLILLSLKPSKKSPNGPVKFATAVVPFHRIGDAFAAVCASEKLKEERGLKGVDVAWAEGKEPEILDWLKRRGKLGGQAKTTSETSTPGLVGGPIDGEKPETPQSKTRPSNSALYSSFPSSFPNLPASTSSPPAGAKPVAGLNYESLTLMRLRQAEKERLEKEILEQEAGS